MLQDIKRSIGEDFSVEYRNYIFLQNKIREDVENDRNTFIERVQGAEMSLFIENVWSVTSSHSAEAHNYGDVNDIVQHILERKKMLETMNQENEKVFKDHMTNFYAIISDSGRSESKSIFIIFQNLSI